MLSCLFLCIPELWGEYDYIVVGAGTSGAVVLSRLSEDAGTKVLAVEAGTWENDLTDIPAFAAYFQQSSYNWAFKSSPSSSAFLGSLRVQYVVFSLGWIRLFVNANCFT